jgi:hypothetical protein
MPSVLCNVALWLEHAKELRALSEVISDPEEKEQMLVVAAGFDRIAELAKEQALLQEQYHRSAPRPARAWRAQKRRARKNVALKARRARASTQNRTPTVDTRTNQRNKKGRLASRRDIAVVDRIANLASEAQSERRNKWWRWSRAASGLKRLN